MWPSWDGKVGNYFYKNIEATDYAEWSLISGSFPPGLELWSNGYIRSTPTATGTYTFTVKAQNVAGSDTKEITINVIMPEEPPQITTSSFMPNVEIGKNYYQTIEATDCAELSLISGSLPPGLTYDGYGSVSGTPTVIGTYTFTLKAENAVGSDEKEFTINVIMPKPPQITISSFMPNGKIGEYYSEWIQAINYAELSLISGDLPPGLTFKYDASGNLGINGIPTAIGTYTFTVKAENAAGSVTKELTIYVINPEPPQIYTDASLLNGKVSLYYSQNIEATDYAKWSLISGSLPTGLVLDNIGSIYGTPTATGTYTFTLKAENVAGSDTKEFTINVIMPELPQIITSSMPNGKVGQYYNKMIDATNYAKFSLINGSLPSGLVLGVERTISGTPTAAGTYTFTVKAENAAGSTTKEFTINIIMPEFPQIITDDSLPEGIVGYGYYDNFVKAADYAGFSLISGSFPPGLELWSNGYIRSTPTATGTYTFTLKAENATGSDTKEFTINVIMPKITDDSLPDGRVGQSYVNTIQAIGYDSWSLISGSLPPGLVLKNWGVIVGTPIAAGTYTFTVKAENATVSDTKEFTINVITLQITTESISNGKIGQYYYQGIEATDYAPWTEWNLISGSLPPGLAFGSNGNSNGYDYGYIHGTPTATGTYTFTIKAENATISDTKEFTINIVKSEPKITTAYLPDGKVGQYYSQWLQATDYRSEWSLANDSLPPGLDVGSGGFISGTPTMAGTYAFTVKVENEAGSDEKLFSITIIGQSEACIAEGNVWEDNSCRAKTKEEVCIAMGNQYIDGICKTQEMLLKEEHVCISKGKIWENDECKTIPIPVSISQITPKTILLSNLPKNTKVEVYNLQGKRIYSAYPENPKILKIGVQTKGVYIVKVGTKTMRMVVR